MTSPSDTSDDGPTKPPPKVAAETLALRAQRAPRARLNPRAIAVLAGGLAAAMLVALLWGLEPRGRSGEKASSELYNVEHSARPEQLETLARDYSQLSPPMEAQGTSVTESQAFEPVQPGADQKLYGDDASALKEGEQARLSPLFFQTGQSRSAGKPHANTGDTMRRIEGRERDKALFSGNVEPQANESGLLHLPTSPYQVMAGTVIAAALVTGIKSDLPGDVIATVTEPVYDTATGQHVLIPQGSRLLGRYDSRISYGQSRVDVVWHRLIFPDTSSLKLDGPVASDPEGYAGLQDGVDWHWDRIVAGAALTSLLGIGAELAAPANRIDGDRIVIAGRDGLQDSVNQVGQEVTRRNIDIRPSLTQRPGLPLRIIVNCDFVLRPYRPLNAPISSKRDTQ